MAAEKYGWLLDLARTDLVSADLTESAVDLLAELRPGSAGTSEVRILFVFDPTRCAVLLVAGDKAGSWNSWYNSNIPLAEQRYDEHLANAEKR